MTNEKKRRLIVSATATAVLLLVFLVGVMIYQMVSISAKNRQLEAGKKEIEQLMQQREELEEGIELWLTDFKIIQRAREIGYKLDGK